MWRISVRRISCEFLVLLCIPSLLSLRTGEYQANSTMTDEEYSGTPEPDTFYPQCGVPVNQYLWLNSLHPTGPIHEVVAAGVADLLEAGPNIC